MGETILLGIETIVIDIETGMENTVHCDDDFFELRERGGEGMYREGGDSPLMIGGALTAMRGLLNGRGWCPW